MTSRKLPVQMQAPPSLPTSWSITSFQTSREYGVGRLGELGGVGVGQWVGATNSGRLRSGGEEEKVIGGHRPAVCCHVLCTTGIQKVRAPLGHLGGARRCRDLRSSLRHLTRLVHHISDPLFSFLTLMRASARPPTPKIDKNAMWLRVFVMGKCT